MRFAFIDSEKAHYPVGVLCRVMCVSRSGYYASCLRRDCNHSRHDRKLGVLVREAHAKSRGTYGSPRVHVALRRQGIHVGRKRVARVMRQHGLSGKRRRRWTRTTISNEGRAIGLNVLNRAFNPQAPNQSWVGDVTYLKTPHGWLYLAVIIDLYSRRVVGWALSAENDTALALAALDAALQHRKPEKGLLHHTDQGSPYASEAYQEALKEHGVQCSMSRRGNCYDNAVAESFFGTLKTEAGDEFLNYADAKSKLFDYIEVFYNRQRMHSTNGHRSPAEFESMEEVSKTA
jgi:putative transposase